MLATAIIGSTVGVKKASRRNPRPLMLRLTHSAINSANVTNAGGTVSYLSALSDAEWATLAKYERSAMGSLDATHDRSRPESKVIAPAARAGACAAAG